MLIQQNSKALQQLQLSKNLLSEQNIWNKFNRVCCFNKIQKHLYALNNYILFNQQKIRNKITELCCSTRVLRFLSTL